MSASLEEGYRMFRQWKAGDIAIWINPIAMCIFDNHQLGIDGLANRNKIREAYPDVYKDLKEVKTLEDFIAVVGRVKLHLFTKER